jgi:3-oxoacyl-[acyl-carrier protein] reductase
MSGLLDGHIAVVTGAGSGIGHAIALGYAGEGAQVAVLDVNGEAAVETVQQILNAGGKADSFTLDVTKREDCVAVAKQVADKVGQVSILVNNAGINRRNAFTAAADAVIKDWQDILAINLNGVFNVTHAFLDQLRATKGRIVNIASIQAFMHVRTPNSPAYTTSKHGVLGFTRALAAELGRDGVRVNAIGPGLIETPLNAQVRANNPSRSHAARPRRQAGGYRRPGDLPRLGPLGLCHRLDRDGGRRVPDDLVNFARCVERTRNSIALLPTHPRQEPCPRLSAARAVGSAAPSRSSCTPLQIRDRMSAESSFPNDPQGGHQHVQTVRCRNPTEPFRVRCRYSAGAFRFAARLSQRRGGDRRCRRRPQPVRTAPGGGAGPAGSA